MKKFKISTIAAIAVYTMLSMVFLSGCDIVDQYVIMPTNKPYLLIIKVELTSRETLGKYVYTTKNELGYGNFIFYIDEKMNVGDTLWIGKKCQ